MKRNTLLTSFIILIVSLVFLQIGVLPQYHQYAQLREQLRSNEEVLAGKKEYYAQLFTVEQKLNSQTESFAKVSSALPVLPDTAALCQFIEQKAGENGLVIENFGGLKINKDPKGKLGVIKFGAIARGNYPSLVNFLKTVEESSRLIEVKSVTSKSKDTNQKNKGTQTPSYDLTFVAHYCQGI